MELTRTFSNIGKGDVSVAGGKGASLGEMTQAKIPVPEGFVILSNAFDEFIKETDLNVEIDAILDTVNHEEVHTVEEASEKIQALIIDADIPKETERTIIESFDKLKSKFVAVRSSATSEDSASASWAGQLNTYLNVTKDNLLESVKKCWASLFTPRAIFYRFEKELHGTDISVAVVVQKMVDSEESGIAFSVHPVTEDPNQLIIEAGLGLGEAIVSGQITPDSYVVDKKDWHIIDINVNKQSKGLFRAKEGGNEWKDLGEKGKKQVLSEKEIVELSKLIVKIENHYGFPVDIEWAKKRGKFYIVQTRPITTLGKGQKNLNKIILTKTSTRDFSLGAVQARYKGIVGLLDLLDVNFDREKLFYVAVNKNGIIDSYVDPKVLEKTFVGIVKKIQKDKTFLATFFKNFDECINKLYLFLDKKFLGSKEEFKDFVSLFIDSISFGSLVTVIPMIEKLPKEIINKALDYRIKNDKIMDYGDLLIKETVKHLYPNVKSYEKYISLEEIKSGKLSSIKDLEKRREGYIYTDKLLIGLSKEEFSSTNRVSFEEDPTIVSTDNIKGEVAYKGKARGKVKIIFLKEELDRLEKGDILVTSMTTPLFISAMKKATAFVTDEGGIGCHAAIIARELKKPCIVGTKNATQVLKDGDVVEVNGDKGIVKIIKPYSF